MRILALITMAGGVACGAMAGWGMFTDAGRRHFDEMAGIIPLAAGAGVDRGADRRRDRLRHRPPRRPPPAGV
jgi:hypothetical protein